MSNIITIERADRIAVNAVIDAFKARKEKLLLIEHEKAFAAWCFLYGEHAKALAKINKDLFRTSNQLKFNVGGWSVDLKLPPDKYLAVKSGYGDGFCGNISDPAVVADIQAFVKQRTALEEEIKSRTSQLAATIRAARTWKKLAELWPEGKEFFAKDLADADKPGTNLTVNFDTLNKALGLPKEVTANGSIAS